MDDSPFAVPLRVRLVVLDFAELQKIEKDKFLALGDLQATQFKVPSQRRDTRVSPLLGLVDR